MLTDLNHFNLANWQFFLILKIAYNLLWIVAVELSDSVAVGPLAREWQVAPNGQDPQPIIVCYSAGGACLFWQNRNVRWRTLLGEKGEKKKEEGSLNCKRLLTPWSQCKNQRQLFYNSLGCSISAVGLVLWSDEAPQAIERVGTTRFCFRWCHSALNFVRWLVCWSLAAVKLATNGSHRLATGGQAAVSISCKPNSSDTHRA